VRRVRSRPRWQPMIAGLLVALAWLSGCSNALPPQARPTAPFTPPPAQQAYPVNGTKQFAVGIDDLGTGFNSHLISDLGPVATAVDALVLPSVFRPGPDGQPVLNTAVANSAKVTSTAPFTVSYELNLSAAWSDNTPIAAEDFVYLWQQMRTEPGVVDNAGYRLITDVRSRAGGKAVDVVFAQPDPHWRELFADLLPAHILKDAPTGWRTAMTDGVPVSGGPFEVSQVDRARGQLVLMRNDHYWATPSVLDSLIFRRTDTQGLLDGLRASDPPLAQVWPDAATLAALHGLGPAARLQAVPQPTVVQLGMRTDQGVMTDVRVRQAIGALLDRDRLIALGTGGGVGGARDDAQLLAPSQPGYHPTAPKGAPITRDPALAERLLTSAGYVRDAQGHWTLLGSPLKVTIGSPTDRPRFAEIADEVQRELTAAGIQATAITAPGPALFTDPTVLPSGAAAPARRADDVGPPLVGDDADGDSNPASLVGPAGLPVPSGASPAEGIAPRGSLENPERPNRHPGAGGVAPTPTSAAVPTAASGSAVPTAAAQQPGAQPAVPPAAPSGVMVDLLVMPRAIGDDAVTTAASNYGCPPGMAGVAQPARNPTGFCSPGLQPTLDAALAGGLGAPQAAGVVESTLWRELPAIPLFQMVTTLASTPTGDRLTGGVGPGPLTVGPFGTAVAWQPSTPH
jgi:ABC-type transport system substrate-binding protein